MCELDMILTLRDAGTPIVCVEEIVGVDGWIHSVGEIQTFPGCQWVQRVCFFCPTENVGCAHEVTCVGWEVGRGGECGPRRLGLASFRLRKSRPGQKHAKLCKDLNSVEWGSWGVLVMADEEISGSVDAAKEATAWVKTRGGDHDKGLD